MTTTIYGIKNCDTMKKALKWLEANNIPYNFIDYKKEGADESILKTAITEHGWDTVINRRGTTWRALPDTLKESMDEPTAIAEAIKNPSLIKRPLLVKDGKTYLGFKDTEYEKIFA